MLYNGKWKMVRSDVTDLENWELHLESEGKDNNRKAAFRKQVIVSPNRIEAIKMVKYLDEDGDYFVRNRHIFER